MQSEGTANYYVGHNVYTQRNQLLDFMLHDILRQTEFRNTIHQHATSLMESFEQGNIITHLS